MKIEWKKVTWYSQIIAIVIFVAVFFVGFFFGKKYESSRSVISGWAPPRSSVVASASFTCSAGKSIQAVFLTTGAEVTLSDGRSENLTQAESADGGRYTNSDESFVFWTKGNGAFVTENGVTTYVNCVATK